MALVNHVLLRGLAAAKVLHAVRAQVALVDLRIHVAAPKHNNVSHAIHRHQ